MSIHQVPDEPVLVLDFDDQSDEQSVHNTYLRSIELAKNLHGSVYRLVDLRQATLTYRRIVGNVRDLATGLSGAGTPPDLAMVFVGQPEMASALRNMGVTFFESMDAALDYAVEELHHSLPTL